MKKNASNHHLAATLPPVLDPLTPLPASGGKQTAIILL